MRDNIILIPPCCTYGDILSIIGMIYYLLKYYNKVHLYINYPCDYGAKVINYYICYFSNCEYYNNRIFIIINDNIHPILANAKFGEYDICNLNTIGWTGADFTFHEYPSIDKQYYFNDLNPLYNKLVISEDDIYRPNTHYPNHTLELNHLFYYKLVGLNNNVRMQYFHYARNHEIESHYKKKILEQYNINENDKYNIINSADQSYDVNIFKKYAKNNYPFIDIHNLIEFPGYLLSLIENAESIHFIEGSNVNFIYHCQYKNIVNIKSPIYFYIFLRNRSWPYLNMNLCEAWKMMLTPKLDNWFLLHTPNTEV